MPIEHGVPIRYAQSAVLPYAPDLLFDLVADIERYPEFLHEYRAVRICSRTDDTLQVDQVIGFARIELTLHAVARLQRPESIIVRSSQMLLGDLEIRWDFEPSGTSTRVDFHMALTPPSRFAAGLAEYLLMKSATRTLDAFTERAQQIHGCGSGASE
jgi:coenzyme Q-binding protein COQ10